MPIAAAALALLAGCADTRMTTTTMPKGATLAAGVKVPNDVQLAVYLPAAVREERLFLEQFGLWLEPGKGLEQGVQAVLSAYFPAAHYLDLKGERSHGLVLDLDPEWKFEAGQVSMTMAYRVFADPASVLLEGKHNFAAPMGTIGGGAGFYNATLKATQLVALEVLNKLQPDAQKFPGSRLDRSVPGEKLADMAKPVSTGTGFFVNAAGQALTAAHVLDNCLVVEVKSGERKLPSRNVASSALLDVALIDTGAAAASFLPLRKGQTLVLGEPVSYIGFPLQGLLAAAPNLTRGNVSSRSALTGSVGLFQFSAPIQPGASGGPVISDAGELLGMAVSTLNVAALVEQGALPQNVNFALDAKYVAMFMRKQGVAFSEYGVATTSAPAAARPGANTGPMVQVPATPVAPPVSTTDAALAAVVQVACYQ